MPTFRAKQILEWVYQKGVADPEKMSNLSKLDRDRLARDMTFLSGRTLAQQAATDGVQKLLIEWDDWAEKDGEGASQTSQVAPGAAELVAKTHPLPQLQD